MVMPHDPNPDPPNSNVVEEVVGKPFQVAPPQSAGIKMKEFRRLGHLPNAKLKLSKKVISEFRGNLVVLLKNLIHIRLNSAVEPNLHDS